MSPNILETTATCGNCQTLFARNDKNNGKLSTGISVRSFDQSENPYLRFETHYHISKCKVAGSLCKYKIILHISYTRNFPVYFSAVAVKTQKFVWAEEKTTSTSKIIKLNIPFLVIPPILKFPKSPLSLNFCNMLQDFSHNVNSSHNTYLKKERLSYSCLNRGSKGDVTTNVQKQIYLLAFVT